MILFVCQLCIIWLLKCLRWSRKMQIRSDTFNWSVCLGQAWGPFLSKTSLWLTAMRLFTDLWKNRTIQRNSSLQKTKGWMAFCRKDTWCVQNILYFIVEIVVGSTTIWTPNVIYCLCFFKDYFSIAWHTVNPVFFKPCSCQCIYHDCFPSYPSFKKYILKGLLAIC